MLTSWVDETLVATSVPNGNIGTGSKFSNDWSCRWLVDLAQEGQRTKSCLPCISSWWWILVFCESSPRSQWNPCSSTRFDHAKQGIGWFGTQGSSSMPIEPPLFLRKFDLIQSVIADMDLDPYSLSQVEEAFISEELLISNNKRHSSRSGIS